MCCTASHRPCFSRRILQLIIDYMEGPVKSTKFMTLSVLWMSPSGFGLWSPHICGGCVTYLAPMCDFFFFFFFFFLNHEC